MFRQTPISNETPREFPVCFPPGTIFRAVDTKNASARFTILVKNDGTMRTLRWYNDTWKNAAMYKGYDGLMTDTFLKSVNILHNWTITADVATPREWWFTIRTIRDTFPNLTHEEFFQAVHKATEQRKRDWRAYLEQLQALYPFFTTIEDAPASARVSHRMVASLLLRLDPQPQQPQVPELLMPPQAERPCEDTITLTRDQMNYIYTMASGRALTDEVWAVVKQVAIR